MVEREIETTVTVEKEREVTETYLDDETVTDTITFCDACGEACDERGGHVPVYVGEDPVDMRNYAPTSTAWATIEDNLLDHFVRIGDQMDADWAELEIEQSRDIDMHMQRDGSFVSVPETTHIRVPAGSTYMCDRSALHQKIGDAVKDAADEFEVPTNTPEHDFCAHCLASLEDTSGTLETASYEPTTSDDSDDHTPATPGSWSLVLFMSSAVCGAFLISAIALVLAGSVGVWSAIPSAVLFYVWAKHLKSYLL